MSVWGSAVGVRVSLATGIITRNYAAPPTSVRVGRHFAPTESLTVMRRMIFVNLPVADLPTSRDFYTSSVSR